MDRDIREKSQSDERSIIHGHSSGGGGQWGKVCSFSNYNLWNVHVVVETA